MGPLTLVPGPGSTCVLWVHAATGCAGCKDHKARLTAVDRNTLEGGFDDGRIVRGARE